jgi:hypothetical protein
MSNKYEKTELYEWSNLSQEVLKKTLFALLDHLKKPS